jgi:hypothetical protein
MYTFFNLGTGFGWAVSAMPRPLYRGKDPVPIVHEAGWDSGPVWMGAKNLAATGIRSLDRPAHSSCYIDCDIPTHNRQK